MRGPFTCVQRSGFCDEPPGLRTGGVGEGLSGCFLTLSVEGLRFRL
jgi:hypothetical protein